MQLLSVIFLPVLLFASQATAPTWYFLRYNTPSGAKFTAFSGQMVIPALPKAAVYYLWPGLQPTDNSGVYQNVLDGRSGTWWFGSGWCCSNPSLPDGSGWTTTTTRGTNGSPVTNTFSLAGKSFNQAIFAIELYNMAWTFGPLTFKNIKIKTITRPQKYTISGAKASVSGTTVICTINSVVLQGPA
ncbi:hypothetical protein QBC32DRAFT_401177 [Pseudoneurospora amorphoporcata]|uniref:Uncharacterized protein n=1 Tax=Pseudoneurospora amorphoporcata TaxID=241081 RepID=A0AAN6SC05_9PEZI|nr:hypothetical protein QBC32DRAFT_401177 [Pseudoneurospora amorphoporcata]